MLKYLLILSLVVGVAYAQPLVPNPLWAGFIAYPSVNPNSVTQVSATWRVPTVNTPTDNYAYMAQWIGIGGVNEQDLIQVGTESDNNGGTGQYYAWIETLPSASNSVFTVNANDLISANISLISANLWQINITDLTTNQSYFQQVSYSSSQATAEWIVERPLVDGYPSALAQYNITAFNNVITTINGTTNPLCDFSRISALMYAQNGYINSAPTNIVSCNSFSIDYINPNQDALASQFNQLNVSINNLNGEYNNLNNQVSNLSNGLTNLSNSLSTVNNNVSSISDKLNATNANLNNLNNVVSYKLQQLSTAQQTFQNQQSQMQSQIQAINAQQSSQENQINSLSSSVLTLSNATSTLINSTNTLAGNVNSLTGTVNNQGKLIANVSEQTNTNSNNISNLTTEDYYLLGILIIILIVLSIMAYDLFLKRGQGGKQ
ncbi:MAG: G1 family glutamic endopeptidase [Gammaproteobacteria bacterium]